VFIEAPPVGKAAFGMLAPEPHQDRRAMDQAPEPSSPRPRFSTASPDLSPRLTLRDPRLRQRRLGLLSLVAGAALAAIVADGLMISGRCDPQTSPSIGL